MTPPGRRQKRPKLTILVRNGRLLALVFLSCFAIIRPMKRGWTLIFLIAILVLSWLVKVFWFSGRQLDFSGEKFFRVNDNGHLFAASASAATVGEYLESQKIMLGEHDVVFPERGAKLLPGSTIQISRALPVKILVDGKEVEQHTFCKDVKSVLREAGVALSHLDKVGPGIERGLERGMEIVVTRINVEQVTQTEPIEFETVEKQDKKLKWRKKKVEQKGAFGEKEVKYEITYKNGRQVSKEKLSTKIVKKPTDEIVKIGTKVEVGKTQKGRASWYAYTGTMACASVKFPKGTWLRVTSRASGKRIFVQVNDYGPDPGTGKVIDLDAVAFKQLAPLGAGVIEVKVEEILE